MSGAWSVASASNALMQQAALWLADLCIGYLAQLIVREVVAERAVFADDPCVPEFVQRMHDVLALAVAGAGQQLGREGAPDDCGQFGACAAAAGVSRAMGGGSRVRVARTISTMNRG